MTALFAEAAVGLIKRYTAITADAWKHRLTNDSESRPEYELAFLPANVELAETPVHPAPRWTLRVMLGLLSAVTMVAVFGELDIVAVAPGRLIPAANVKVIQPAVTGVVRSIFVQNGQRVSAGQVLVELNPVQAAADKDAAKAAAQDAELEIALAAALLDAQANRLKPKVSLVLGAPAARQEEIQRLAQGSFREYRDKLASENAELKKREAELAESREEVKKLEETAPLARQEADDYKALSANKYVASHDYLDKEQGAIQQAGELAADRKHASELEAAVDEQRHDIDATVATFRRQQLDDMNKAEQGSKQHRDEETKATVREELMKLVAPVDGYVQQLSIHTIGGVVTTAQSVLEIVPDDTLEVEATIGNQDIGFVREGESAAIKLMTFPYTRYGYLTGKVIRVSNDAMADKKRGWVFLSRIQIPSNRFKVAQKWLTLTPGMEVTAEIRTGRQKVWQYLLSPLLQTGRESLRER